MESSLQIENWLKELTLEEKCLFLTGGASLRSASNERMNIPYINMSDGPHGIRRLLEHPVSPQKCNIEGGDVCFPTASAVAASWNKEVAYAAGHAIAGDCHEEDIDLLLAPAINMKRTPLCGRNFEYYSEDPVLAGEMAAAFICGVQDGGVGTSLKHFAVNNQERDRGTISVETDEKTLREYYLEAFRIAIEKGKPETVMCAYNKLAGIWCSENKWLLTEVLKEEWEYDGLIVSDWGAVHNAPKAFAAGLELQMPRNPKIYDDMLDGIKKGIISEDRINQCCRKVLELILRRVSKRTKPAYNRVEQHRKAYEAATECITLLKNENNILPIIPEKYKKIAVFGDAAENPIFMGGGSSQVTVEDSSVDKPLDYIKKYCEQKADIIYEPLYTSALTRTEREARIEKLSCETDLAIVFAGMEIQNESECVDRKRLTFPETLNDLIEKIDECFDNVVVVMQTGCCTTGSGWEKNVKGIIQMWLAGEGGGKAIADILFGAVNPSGKLSETFMKELPSHILNISRENKIIYSEGMECGYRYYDRHPDEVWYPFGHGLSYTKFEYSDMKIFPQKQSDPNATVTVTFQVKNVGDVFGKEAVQLYVKPVACTVCRPQKELKGFEKVALNPGESKTVTINLDSHAFAYYNVCLHEWHVESGEYKICVAASSADIRLEESYFVNWDKDYTTNQESGAMVL